jgi:23S rRNA (adenine2030-N6)-methyltransferase
VNYRHIYHAGHLCDVAKHTALCVMLGALRRKATPFFVLDTHAGIGRYDLTDARAQTTGEASVGIGALRRVAAQVEALPLAAEYWAVCRAVDPDGAGSAYPGSPLFARHFLREGDRLALCELHPDEAATLRRLFRDDKAVQVHQRDGYEALRALLPPPEKRGLVLIDPPFEEEGEFDRLVAAAETLAARFANAVGLFWYPIKDRVVTGRFYERMAGVSRLNMVAAELLFGDDVRGDRLNGSGLILINPPWHVAEDVATLGRALLPLLDLPEGKVLLSPLAGAA